MSLSTVSGGCAFRPRRRKNKERGFFLVEVLVLSFLVLGCAGSALVYRALSQNCAAIGAELTAAYLAQEQLACIEARPASYLRAHTQIPWLGKGTIPVEKNGTRFEILSSLSPHAEAGELAEAEVRVRWQAGGSVREKSYRKLVAYHE